MLSLPLTLKLKESVSSDGGREREGEGDGECRKSLLWAVAAADKQQAKHTHVVVDVVVLSLL